MSSSHKIVPAFAGPLTANGLKVWLGSCEDAFDNFQDTHDDKVLAVKTRIRLTGAALIEPQMAEWWASGKAGFLVLATWELFVQKIKDRFMPVNWKMDALEQFFGCVQGKRDFRTYAADLAQCLGTLPASTISTTIYKYHILFYCHPLLYLRMRALQGFDIDSSNQTPDILIALMAAQWDSLIADSSSRSIRSSATVATPSSMVPPSIPLLTTASSSASPAFVPITEEEKTSLAAARGCWNCRFKPGDPGWIPHQRHTCPGNPAVGARPGRDFVPGVTPPQAPTPTVTVGAALTTNYGVRGPPHPDQPPYVYPGLVGAAFARSPSPVPRDDDTESDSDDGFPSGYV